MCIKKVSGKTKKPAKVVHFVIELVPDAIKVVQLSVLVSHLSSSGTVILSQPLLQMISVRRNLPDFITIKDAELIETLQNCYHHIGNGVYRLQKVTERAFLRDIIKTGRCFWESCYTPPLKWAGPVDGQPIWQALDEARLRLVFAAQRPVEALPINPLPYYDPSRHALGWLRHTANSEVVRNLLQYEAIRRADLNDLEWTKLGLPVPPTVRTDLIQAVKPKPIANLVMLDKASIPEYILEPIKHWFGRRSKLPVINLQFDYQGYHIDSEIPTREQILVRDGACHFVKIDRDMQEENCIIGRVEALGLECIKIGTNRAAIAFACVFDNLEKVWSGVITQLNNLRKEGWQINLAANFLFLENEQIQLSIKTGEIVQGSFAVELQLSLGEQKTSILSLLRKWYRSRGIQEKRPFAVPLKSGKMFFISAQLATQMANTLFPVLESDWIDSSGIAKCPAAFYRFISSLSNADNIANFSSLQNNDDLNSSEDRVANGAVAALAASDFQLSNSKLTLPKSLAATLRDYQKKGVAWLQWLRLNQVNGILADDMGLGKTIQVIAHLLMEKEAGRLDNKALIVAPTSLMFNWQNELKRFAPSLVQLVFHGAFRHELRTKLDLADIVVTSYALLIRDLNYHQQREWSYIVLDESQKIKNPETAVAKAACSLRAAQRICLTGTPIENHTGELWSQFNFLMPGMLGTRRGFIRQIQQPIEKDGDQEKLIALRNWVSPYILRRTKDQVLAELPAKTEMIRKVQLSDAQLGMYERYREAALRLLNDSDAEQAGGALNAVSALLKLRQICCDPRLVEKSDKSTHADSAKLEMLCEMVVEMVEEGRKILIFSQFVSMLELIDQAMDTLAISTLMFTGQTQNREAVVSAFQQGEASVFLISLKAGGVGLNLTAADVVIHYDPWWNPAAEDQATDRAYRIGQTQPVFTYRLIAAGTVEEKIQTMQVNKRNLSESVVPDNFVADLTQAEMLSLLQPVEL